MPIIHSAHIFSDRARQIAILACAQHSNLVRIANGAVAAPPSSDGDAALITAAASVEVALGTPPRARVPAALALRYLAWLAGETDERSGDAMLKLAARSWYQFRREGRSDALGLALFARMLCHALHLAFDPACCCFPDRALAPDIAPAAAIAPDTERDLGRDVLRFNVYWKHAFGARLDTFEAALTFLDGLGQTVGQSDGGGRRRVNTPLRQEARA